ncbi:PEP-CTERM sorting domain-containing protein [Roseateles sp.]|uniref:PEP-CTERM sorting domain-containing protein n=1 Tax=Roseateles sp. TaxID=1971397 RepID=UPI003266D5DB
MIRKTLLAAVLTGFALQAQAATVAVNVSTDEFTAGPLAGQTLTGQLNYDDSTLTTVTAWLPLLSFSFTVNGLSYTLAGTELGDAVVTFTAGSLTGLDAAQANPATYDFTFSSGFGSPYVFYQSGNDTGDAVVSFDAVGNTVPEPASYALVVAALGGGLFARRRKA